MNYRKVIIFGAHPDDEITMGGTIYKMAKNGTEVIVVTMTDGCEGYSEIEMKDKIVEIRKKEAKTCDMILGFQKEYFLNFLIWHSETVKKSLKNVSV